MGNKELRNQLTRDLASLDSAEGTAIEEQRKAIKMRMAELDKQGDDELGDEAEAGAATAGDEEEGGANDWEGVNISAAARARAEELGMTPENFKRRRATGRSGFVVSDVDRIHTAIGKAEDADDGND